MKVLYVIHGPTFGGAHNQALRLHAPLTARGVETTVVLPTEGGNAAERLRAGGVPVVEIPLHRVRAALDPRLHLGLAAGLVPEVRALRRVIREHGADVVQVGGLVNPHGALAGRLERLPVVWQLLDTRAPWAVAFGAMLGVRALATVVMPTGSKVLAAFPGTDRMRGRIVPFIPPVDTAMFHPRPELRTAVRREWGVPDGVPVIGTVGNLNPMKGHETLLEAFRGVRARLPDTRLVMLGSEHGSHAEYARRIRALVHELEPRGESPVIFLGARGDVERQIQGFDVLALASVPRSEGIPTAILEAMASAVAVVATDVGGVTEVVDDGVSGRVVPPLDAAALSAALMDVLGDAAGRAAMASNAHRIAVERFSIEHCADTHLRAYELALRYNAAGRGSLSAPSNRVS